MGDFKGDGLVELLAFYENTNPPGTEVQWGMMALFLYDPTVPWNFKEGPELSATTLPTPVAGALSWVGDFNGDGRSEIAALLNDYQTVAFYSVDPKTFAIAPITTVKLSANIPTIGNFPLKMNLWPGGDGRRKIPSMWRQRKPLPGERCHQRRCCRLRADRHDQRQLRSHWIQRHPHQNHFSLRRN